jgi:thiamine-phosphate pyrophosphorylase
MALLEVTFNQTWRIIDANLNRIGEGIRVLEDVARLLLNDVTLTEKLKTMRHDLVRQDLSFNRQLLQSRDSNNDVGSALEVTGEEKEKDLPSLVIANSRRVQEALRTLEEIAKTPDIISTLDSEKFKKARFDLYAIEQELMSGMMRKDKLKCLSGLYVILDTQALQGRNHVEVAGQVIKGGASVIQLRDKMQSRHKLLRLARELKKLCSEHGVLFIVNDYLDLVLAADADGLHLGQDDLPVSEARRLLPTGKIIGCSTTGVDQAVKAQSDGADYVAVGAIYPTPSKTSTTTPAMVVGLQMIREVRSAVSIPLIAIGGITADNISDVKNTGADAVAVIGAVLGAESPEEATRKLIERFENKK